MTELLPHLLIVMVPLVLTNVLHMLVVKYNLWSGLTLPIHEKSFGKNKTWRGFLFVPIANAFMLGLVSLLADLKIEYVFLLGGALGIAYVVSELPNSFIKRRLGILPGMKSETRGALFMLMDKTDSAFGVTFTYFLLGYVDVRMAFLLFAINSLTHVLVSLFLVTLKIKTSF